MPELADLSQEPEAVFARYGLEARKPGSYAANCLTHRYQGRDFRLTDVHGHILSNIIA